MSRIPLLRIAMVALSAFGCGTADDTVSDGSAPDNGAPALPFNDGHLEDDAFFLLRGEHDTLHFSIRSGRRGVRIARYHDTALGRDSLVALVGGDDLLPIRSFQRVHREDGSLEAEVLYGRGFDGQARLTITAPDGQRNANVRTPQPTLDVAQLPIAIQHLDFSHTEPISFNLVAPFEQRAIPARLEIGSERSIRIGDQSVDARPVVLRVSGLEERYWFSASSPHDLLRIEEVTRGRTWSRR